MIKRKLPPLKKPSIQKPPDSVEIPKEHPNIPEMPKIVEKNNVLRSWYFCGFGKRRPRIETDLQ